MKRKILTITGIILMILFSVQIAIMAVNNQKNNEEDFNEDDRAGTKREARDKGVSSLYSSADTSVTNFVGQNGAPNTFVWVSMANASYTGGDLMAVTKYDLKSTIWDYFDAEKTSLLGSPTGESTFLQIMMTPPADNVVLDIDDCESYAKADLTDGAGNKDSTHSEIPFPNEEEEE